MSKFKPVTNLVALNEAYEYPKPSLFSRGLSYTVGDTKFIYISGTASIDANGDSLFQHNFEAQCLKAFSNVRQLLESEGATWKDVIKTTIYLKEMELHYDRFNLVRKTIFGVYELDVYPASTCVQATLCRPELLIELDAVAILNLGIHGSR